MRRGWKILIGALVLIAVLLAVNTLIVDNQTKGAEVTVEGGRILALPGGEVQVVEEGQAAASVPTIVLVHCYSCSLHWWDRIAPILARRHRVIRVDLLGHGGSQKPTSGYQIKQQAALVAGALEQLGVEGAVVVGHSLGFSVATELAASASQLVDRLVNIDAGPSPDDCSEPFLARLGYVPVLGQAMWRLTPSFAIEDGYGSAFAPGFDLPDGFPNPDQVVDDFRSMTYGSYRDAHEASDDYLEAGALNDRLRTAAIPLLSIFGSEDQICDPESSQEAYETVPGVRLAEVEGAGHSPNVEKPAATAALITEFTADAGDDSIPPPPKDLGQGQSSGKPKAAKSKPG